MGGEAAILFPIGLVRTRIYGERDPPSPQPPLDPNDHYRRIVFYIPYVTKRAFELKVPFLSSTEVSESYFLIEEMAAISKPANGFDE